MRCSFRWLITTGLLRAWSLYVFLVTISVCATGFSLLSLPCNRHLRDANHLVACAEYGGSLREMREVFAGSYVGVNGTNMFGQKPLVSAAKCGHAHVVAYLLGRGARVNLVNGKGVTALMAAAKHGHSDVIRQLLEASARLTREQADALSLAGRKAVLCEFKRMCREKYGDPLHTVGLPRELGYLIARMIIGDLVPKVCLE